MQAQETGGLAAAQILVYFITACPPVCPRKRGRDIISDNGKKMGRPYVGDEPKDKRISLRATTTTVRKFDECSETLQKSKTDLLEDMVNTLYNEVCKEKE